MSISDSDVIQLWNLDTYEAAAITYIYRSLRVEDLQAKAFAIEKAMLCLAGSLKENHGKLAIHLSQETLTILEKLKDGITPASLQS